MKIAWIDDDTDIIEPVVKPLVRDGHDILRARSIHEALDIVDRIRDCDLVLLDMILPSGDNEDYGYYSGISLLRRLREQYEIAVPVIVFSVVDKAKLEEQLSPLCISGYVRKPALPSELENVVNAVWERGHPRAPTKSVMPEDT